MIPWKSIMFVLGFTIAFYPKGIDAMCVASGLSLVGVSILNFLDDSI
jgi:hypothetical protein